jgi:hypothetical protein
MVGYARLGIDAVSVVPAEAAADDWIRTHCAVLVPRLAGLGS